MVQFMLSLYKNAENDLFCFVCLRFRVFFKIWVLHKDALEVSCKKSSVTYC